MLVIFAWNQAKILPDFLDIPLICSLDSQLYLLCNKLTNRNISKKKVQHGKGFTFNVALVKPFALLY